MATNDAKPRISILDRRFKYRNAANTDVRRTFERARQALRQVEKSHQVVPMRKRGASC